MVGIGPAGSQVEKISSSDAAKSGRGIGNTFENERVETVIRLTMVERQLFIDQQRRLVCVGNLRRVCQRMIFLQRAGSSAPNTER